MQGQYDLIDFKSHHYNEELYRSAFDKIPEGIIMTDSKCTILLANKFIQDYFQPYYPDIIDANLIELLRPLAINIDEFDEFVSKLKANIKGTGQIHANTVLELKIKKTLRFFSKFLFGLELIKVLLFKGLKILV